MKASPASRVGRTVEVEYGLMIELWERSRRRRRVNIRRVFLDLEHERGGQARDWNERKEGCAVF
jgi:hypothetical protein